MKTKFLLGLAGLAIVAIGCVGTVSGKKTAAVPFIKDRIEGRYERPASQVFDAAKEVVRLNGTLLSESTLHGGTNAAGVLALEGKVNQRRVWMSVEQIDPKISAVIVQARTKGGGRDIELCHELEKQIALKLVR
ncbi:MAG: hypothetical protein MUF81_09450 [Verrucomicrobia bacterium]|jgi:hypothetical protein|nr:hypothetical protein [Verrucomicrobiota bacterium]